MVGAAPPSNRPGLRNPFCGIHHPGHSDAGCSHGTQPGDSERVGAPIANIANPRSNQQCFRCLKILIRRPGVIQVTGYSNAV